MKDDILREPTPLRRRDRAADETKLMAGRNDARDQAESIERRQLQILELVIAIRQNLSDPVRVIDAAMAIAVQAGVGMYYAGQIRAWLESAGALPPGDTEREYKQSVENEQLEQLMALVAGTLRGEKI